MTLIIGEFLSKAAIYEHFLLKKLEQRVSKIYITHVQTLVQQYKTCNQIVYIGNCQLAL